MCKRRPPPTLSTFALWALLTPIFVVLAVAYTPLIAVDCYKDSDFEKQRKDRRARSPLKVNERARPISMGKIRLRQQLLWRSRLEMLPTELNFQVFSHLLETRTKIHIVFHLGRLHSYRCRWWSELTEHKQCWDDYWCRSRRDRSSDPEDGRLGVLGYLQTSSIIYERNVELLYSQPTFLFHDFTSFVAFCRALFPHQFSAIQSITLYSPTNSLYRSKSFLDYMDGDLDILEGRAHYQVLRKHKIKMKFPILLPVPALQKQSNSLDSSPSKSLFQVCKVLRLMTSLREFTIEKGFEHHEKDEACLVQGARTIQERTPPAFLAMNWFYRQVDAEEWRDFDIRTDTYYDGMIWHGVISLSKDP